MEYLHLEWLLWSIILVLIWAIVRATLQSREMKHDMLVVSFWTSFLGLTEPFFVPEYWNPPSLFNLAQTTGFDIESVIFSFGIGGVGFALYMAIFPVKHEPVIPRSERIAQHQKYHFPLLLVTPALSFILILFTPLNPIYSAIICLIIGGATTWYCRPDLTQKMFISALVNVSGTSQRSPGTCSLTPFR